MRTLPETGTSTRRSAGSRLASSLSRLSRGAATPERESSPEARSPVPPGDSASTGFESATASASPAPHLPPRTVGQTLDDWLMLWEERAEQIAYRLSLIDGQFEALIRKREIESASTSPPPIRQTIESLAQLFPEL